MVGTISTSDRAEMRRTSAIGAGRDNYHFEPVKSSEQTNASSGQTSAPRKLPFVTAVLSFGSTVASLFAGRW